MIEKISIPGVSYSLYIILLSCPLLHTMQQHPDDITLHCIIAIDMIPKGIFKPRRYLSFLIMDSAGGSILLPLEFEGREASQSPALCDSILLKCYADDGVSQGLSLNRPFLAK
jgi:hypothetical protein